MKDVGNQVTILGCGTSAGVPFIHCRCSVCRSKNPKNHRLRASLWVRYLGQSYIIDTSPDFRQQMLRAKVSRIDAVLYTHPHADHISGIDDLRSYNFHQGEEIPVYGNQWTIDELIHRYPYIFNPKPILEGGGIPRLIPRLISPSLGKIIGIKSGILAFPLVHGSNETLGFRFGNLAYVTDCNEIPSASSDLLENLETLILDCVRIKPHGTHLNLDRALQIVETLKPKRTLLTHMGHDFDYVLSQSLLPRGVKFAYDGLKIKFK